MFRDLGAVAPVEAARGMEACCKMGRGSLGPPRAKIAGLAPLTDFAAWVLPARQPSAQALCRRQKRLTL